MATKIEQSHFMQYFSVLPDPRKLRNQLYPLTDIISTAVLAILCGYGDWEDVSLWTQGHLPFTSLSHFQNDFKKLDIAHINHNYKLLKFECISKKANFSAFFDQDTCKVFRGIKQKNDWNDITIKR